jgi:hypothetical protein
MSARRTALLSALPAATCFAAQALGRVGGSTAPSGDTHSPATMWSLRW